MAGRDEEIRVIVRAVIDDLARGMREASDTVKKAASESQAAWVANREMFKPAIQGAALFAGAVAAAGAAYGAFLRSVIDSRSRIYDMAQAWGSSAENVSRFASVARRADIDAQAVGTSIRTLEKALSDAQKPGSDAAEALRLIGFEGKALADLLKRDTVEQLLAILKALGRFENDANRAKIAAKLLGDGFQEMNRLAEQGGDKLTAAMESARAVTTDEAKAAHDAKQAAAELKEEWGKLTDAFASSGAIQAATTLMQGLQVIVQETAGAIKDFITAVQNMGAPTGRLGILLAPFMGEGQSTLAPNGMSQQFETLQSPASPSDFGVPGRPRLPPPPSGGAGASAASAAASAAAKAQREWVRELQESLQQAEALSSTSTAHRLALEQSFAEALKAKLGEQSLAYQQAATQVLQTQRDLAEEQQALQVATIEAEKDAALQELDVQKQLTENQRDRGEISDGEALDRLRAYYIERHRIITEALDQERPLVPPAEQPGIDAQKKDAEGDKKVGLSETMTADQRRIATELQSIFGTVASSFTTMIQQMANRTITLRQAMQQMGQQILVNFLNVVMQKLVAGFVQYMAQMVTAQVTADTARTASTIATETASTGVTVASENVKTQAHAGTAAAGAAEAVADIPYVGPILAIANAAAVYAALISYMVSARGGMDVPSGGAQAQLHAREMVLPRRLAEGVRRLVDQDETGAAARGGQVNVNVTIHAMDGADAERVFRANSRSMARHVARELRLSGAAA